MAIPFEYPKELASYVDLQAKVFLTASDKREKAELLHHQGLLRALGQSLLQATRNKEVIHQQDAAIDLLLEALMQGDSKVASEVLQKVVQDGQIEDTTMERGAREQLAGLKAEVLYQWSANAPNVASSLQSWLPGPVSQKIWANVLKMQQNNLADSQAEARAMSH